MLSVQRPLSLLAVALLLAGCAPAATTPPTTEESVRSAAQRFAGVAGLTVARAADGSVTATGTLDGTGFVARFPQTWNRASVQWAHGYIVPTPGAVEPSAAESLTESPINTALSQGYAVAATAYEKIGVAVKSGIERQTRLRALLRAMGAERGYLVGASMGGNIVMGAVEKNPDDYAGALVGCGVVAGWADQARFASDVRVVYDFFTRGTPYALPGNGADPFAPVPGLALRIQPAVAALFTAAAKDPAGPEARIVAAVSSVVPGFNPDPASFVTVMLVVALGFPDHVATVGGNGVSNVGVVYGSPLLDAATATALNASVARYTTTPEAAAYLAENYTTKGVFKTKVLAFHNTIDPLVPYRHEAVLRERVAAAGNLANLVQQRVTTSPVTLEPKHCDFTISQWNSTWNQLRAWVENGTRPVDGAEVLLN